MGRNRIKVMPCPAKFTERELELHNGQSELGKGFDEVLQQLQNDNLIPPGAMMPRDKCEQASQIYYGVVEMSFDVGETESQKVLFHEYGPIKPKTRERRGPVP